MSNSDDDALSTREGPRATDPQGQAALLLVESLIHGMIGKSMLTVAEAVEIVEVAAEVKLDVAEELGEPTPIMAASLAALNAISGSLRGDIGP